MVSFAVYKLVSLSPLCLFLLLCLLFGLPFLFYLKEEMFFATLNVFCSTHTFSKALALDCYNTTAPQFHPKRQHALPIKLSYIFLESELPTYTMGLSNPSAN